MQRKWVGHRRRKIGGLKPSTPEEPNTADRGRDADHARGCVTYSSMRESTTTMTPEEKFQDYVLTHIEKAEAEIGYIFRGLRELIDQHGAVPVAKMLVDINNVLKPYDGFQVLAEHDLEHLSVEQAIIDFADSGLFTTAEVQTARARLGILKRKKQRERSA
jgi:hypothetical protein